LKFFELSEKWFVNAGENLEDKDTVQCHEDEALYEKEAATNAPVEYLYHPPPQTPDSSLHRVQRRSFQKKQAASSRQGPPKSGKSLMPS
jgi:hypothetical protein